MAKPLRSNLAALNEDMAKGEGETDRLTLDYAFGKSWLVRPRSVLIVALHARLGQTGAARPAWGSMVSGVARHDHQLTCHYE